MSGTDREPEPDDEGTVSDALSTVFSGGALVFGGKVVGIGLGFATQLVMARLLPAAGYGSVVLALSVGAIAGLVARAGLDEGVVRQFPANEADPARARGLARAGLRLALGFGLVVAVGLVVAAPVVADVAFGNPSLTPLLRVAAVGVPFSAVSTVAVSLARGARNARPHTYVNELVRPLARFTLIGALIAAGFGAAGTVAGHTAAVVLGGVAAYALLRRSLPDWDASPVRMNRTLLLFSLPLVVSQGMSFLLINADTLMVGHFLPSGAVGTYNVTFQLRNLVQVALSAVSFLLPPMVARLEVDGRYGELRRVYQVVTKWVLFLTLPVFLTLFFFPERVIVGLFGGQYAAGGPVLRVLLVGAFVTVAMGLNGGVLVGLDRNRVVMYTTALAAAVNIALNALLIPRFGLVGAALASSTAAVTFDSLNVAVLYRSFGLVPQTASELRPILAAVGLAVVGFGATTLGVPVALAAGCWLLAYPLVVLRLGLRSEDLELLDRIEESTGRRLDTVRRLLRSVNG